MSFIRRKLIHGNYYLYLVHSERRGRKVFQVIDEYLGPEEPKELEMSEIEYYEKRRKAVVPNK